MIKASDVQKLRQISGAGMMDCKNALQEVNGDFEAATDYLRNKGLSNASNKSDRATAEGLVSCAIEGNNSVMVELNSETDFVARNEKFQALINNITKSALNFDRDLEEFKNHKLEGSDHTVQEEIIHNISVIGENLNLKRMVKYSLKNEGAIFSYLHNNITPNAGKIGVIVAFESDLPQEKLQSFGKQIAMHIAAAKPLSLSSDELDPKILEKEKQIFITTTAASGKPANVIEKMVEGKIRKFLEEVVLLEQIFVMDGKAKISEVIESKAKELGGKIKIVKFVRFALGE